jgi:hypothetical protein
MAPYLDHAFITCQFGAPEAEVLRSKGFVEGSGNAHPGQGTANRRFFFANFMLELLWVSDPSETASDAVRCTQLWERWSQRDEGLSRFGVLYGGAIQPGSRSPLATRSYFPAYVPPGLSIEIAQGVTLDEPAIYLMPWLSADRPRPNEPIDHVLPVRVVTGLSVGVRDLHSLSDAARWAVDAKLLSFFESDSPVLEIQFESQESRLIDCRPDLPLVFRSTA